MTTGGFPGRSGAISEIKLFENLLQYNFLMMQVLLSREADDACQINKSFIIK